jgi:microcystin degradation protein MlrC
MSPKVFFAALAQETNVFAPLPTGHESFRGRFTVAGHTATGAPPFPESLLAHLERLREIGSIRLVTGPIAGASPSGLVTRQAFESLRDAIVSEVIASQPIDIVAVQLHGAMIAQGYLDCEGDLLERIRAVTGPDTWIGALLDPHAHLSALMLETADILVAYKEYPHTDFRERADELVELLLRAHDRAIRPCSALWDAGVIGVFHTHRPEARAIVERMQSWERSGDALSVSLIHGFPWGDTPDLGTRALVVADRDLPTAERLASELAATAQTVAIYSPVNTSCSDPPIEVIIATERDQARGVDLFTNLGIRLMEKRLIVVKSSQHFYDSFSQIASRILYLDCPGSLQSQLSSFPYHHVERPRWPIDRAPSPPRRVAVRPARKFLKP